mmetsp:Transcript_4034/g.14104  ORF Transcript_4034/g.14104 Transcript_4034/m.14104 type:complete len:981 (-) Transcript_4034:38-2980(-)
MAPTQPHPYGLDVVEALKHSAEQAPRRGDTKQPYSLSATSEELGALGTGISLYFRTLQFFGRTVLAVFVTSSMVTLGWCIWASTADTAPELQGLDTVAAVTLGMMADATVVGDEGTVNTVSYFKTGVGALDGDKGLEKADLLLAAAALDAFAHLALLVAVLWFKRKADALAEEVDARTISIADYSVVVYGFPADVTEKEVREHFEAQGPGSAVHSVTLGKDFGHAFVLQQRLHAQELRLERLMARRAAGRQVGDGKVSKLEALVQGSASRVKERWGRGFNTMAVFVTFAEEDGFLGCLKRYSLWLFQPRAIRFARTRARLSVSRAPEASNVLWENLAHGPMNRLARRLATALFAFVVLLCTFTLLVYAKTLESQLPLGVNCAATQQTGMMPCNDLWQGDGGIGLYETDEAGEQPRGEVKILADAVDSKECEEYVHENTRAWTVDLRLYQSLDSAPEKLRQCAASSCYGCYCEDMGIEKAYNDDDGLRGYCYDYWERKLTVWLLKGVTVAFVALSNFVLKALMNKLGRFEKHHTRSALEHAVAAKLFVVLVSNTLVVTMLVYCHIDALDFMKYLFNGPYEDFLVMWYLKVGSALSITIVVNSILPPVVALANGWLRRFRRRFWRSRVLQRDLNELFVGTKFTLAPRLGQMASAIVVCLSLSTGIPLLTLMLVVNIWLTNACDRYTLLRYARTPAAYDGKLLDFVLDAVPFALLVHFGVGAWMFGSLPSHVWDEAQGHLEDISGVEIDEQSAGVPSQFNLTERLKKVNVIIMALCFFIVLVYILLSKNAKLLARLLRQLTGEKEKEKEDTPPLPEAFGHDRWSGLTTYDVTANPEYCASMAEGGVSDVERELVKARSAKAQMSYAEVEAFAPQEDEPPRDGEGPAQEGELEGLFADDVGDVEELPPAPVDAWGGGDEGAGEEAPAPKKKKKKGASAAGGAGGEEAEKRKKKKKSTVAPEGAAGEEPTEGGGGARPRHGATPR